MPSEESIVRAAAVELAFAAHRLMHPIGYEVQEMLRLEPILALGEVHAIELHPGGRIVVTPAGQDDTRGVVTPGHAGTSAPARPRRALPIDCDDR